LELQTVTGWHWRLNPLRWALKGQIRALSMMVFATVGMSVVLGVLLFQQGQSARQGDASRHLDQAANHLVERYEYLRRSFAERHTDDPLESGDETLLHSLTEAVLAGTPGAEGGFYRAADGRFLGYAYPTYSGSGPKTDMPPAELPGITRVVETAVTRQAAAEERVSAGADLILFRAHPLFEGTRPLGATWVMQRLSGIRSIQQQLYGMGLLGLLAFSGVITAAAWLFAHRLDRGVTRLEAGLQTMEDRLDTPVPSTGVPELDRVGAAINRLAYAVQSHQRQRMELEQHLHRADRLAALGRLVGGVAHEVRNPLASIKLKLHLVQRFSTDPTRLASTFTVIQAEVERLNRLVERLLALAKPAESSRLPTDLGHLLKARLELWEGRAAEQGITLVFQHTPEASEPVAIDRDRIVQIVDNLLANALEAMTRRGGCVTVLLERLTCSEVQIAVSDTGPGVPPAAVEHLFEPFFTTRNDGIGLGLFLSAEMARALGGEIRYRERLGGGSRFEVCLPC
jgi:signal transduction histidine kinase